MKIRKTVGIDLGTTNSVIAMLDATDSALVAGQDEHGQKTVPQRRDKRTAVEITRAAAPE